MAFWLASQREGQQSDWIQRFDSRFWTVNFPRPMMAAVIATGPDSLRVECAFHHRDALCGLIWESEDRHDHPLLAYETLRDYARTTLRFRWRSSGVLPLDAVSGPTLTIEGRDAAGAARSWYVRLWNYASGTPEDAEIVLPFSALSGGWDIAGDPDPVHPSDIDRMFISLVPPGHDPGDPGLLAAGAEGWAELNAIACEGHRPMLSVGDVLVPPHDLQMATAYDDSYNLTPQRLLRNLRGLGYRGRILHYVGMSHFYRLAYWPAEDRLWVCADGALCTPARAWHLAYFEACAAMGYLPIVSLSFELFAEACPDGWNQQAYDGAPALTGWVPPSTLLSPAAMAAQAWLAAVAENFTGLLEQAGLPVLFQIGEPWNWVTASGTICLYDPAMAALLPAHAPIADMRAPLNAAQLAALDTAGELLAQATAAIADAVRLAANGPAEVLLLVFTPTVFDPAMPELRRANLPLQWAWPAFDRLQLEDYDWLTAGAEAASRAAVETVQERLGYPLERQDYLAGFVLDQADAERFWPRIDAALEQASARGVTQRYVWALPQVARDGYTSLPPPEEDAMQAFDDVPYPLPLGRDAGVSPEFATSVSVTASGHERRASLWADARLHFDVGPGIRSEAELASLIAFFRARRGAARGFRLADPFDFSSNGMTGTPSMIDQLLGAGDGLTASFQLVKHYGEAEDPQVRRITRPRAGTIVASVDGLPVSGWTLEAGGRLRFDTAPAEGAAIRAGFLFDVPVRFAEDRLDISAASFAAGEAPSVPLVEIREAV